jgi:hypothetical protein
VISGAFIEPLAFGEDPDLERLEPIPSTLGDGCFFNTSTICLYGPFMGLEVLRRLRLHLDVLAGLPAQPSFANLLIQPLDRSIPNQGSLPTVFSPLKEVVLHYVDIAFRHALGTQPFVDQAHVERAINRIYSTSGYVRLDNDEIALIYILVALGEYSDSTAAAKDDVESDSTAVKG